MPKILLILLLFSIISCSGEHEIILLPYGFTGVVSILYNMEGGVEPEYEKGSRVYRIPKSGVLCTEFDSNEGIRKIHTILYQGKSGTNFPIESLSVKEYQPQIGVAMIPNSADSNIVFTSIVIARAEHADSLIQLRESLDIGKMCR